MSPASPAASSSKPFARPRLTMAGALIGALIALTLSWNFAPTEPRLTAQEQARIAAMHAKPGSCLYWSEPRARDIRIVPCSQPHLFEVTNVVDVSERYPPGAPLPGVEEWSKLAEQICGGRIEEYLGEPLDPYGRYSLNALRPTSAQWTSGERKLRCGLQRTGPGGGLLPTTGHAAEQPQSSVFEPGTCLGIVGKSVGDPVDCSKPHAYEIVAIIDLTKKFKFTEGYPTPEEQQDWLDEKCNAAAKAYTGGANLEEMGLMLTWDIVKKESWLAGSTKVNCKVGKALDDGSGLAPITGSISKKADDPTSSPAPSTTKGG